MGKGGFAKCWTFAAARTNKRSAAKVICKDALVAESNQRKLLNEIKIHNSLKHQNIVGFQTFFED